LWRVYLETLYMTRIIFLGTGCGGRSPPQGCGGTAVATPLKKIHVVIVK
jgi:hypothetical protein